jgi:hypothetical protein
VEEQLADLESRANPRRANGDLATKPSVEPMVAIAKVYLDDGSILI